MLNDTLQVHTRHVAGNYAPNPLKNMPLNRSARDGEDEATAAPRVRAAAVGRAAGPPTPARAALQLPPRSGARPAAYRCVCAGQQQPR